MSRQLQRTDNWTRFAVFLLYAFTFVGKPFAYFGGPLGGALLFNRAICDRIYIALTRRDLLSAVTWAVLLSIMYGICEVVYGVLSGNDPALALRTFVFNLCPLFLFLGIWAGSQKPSLVRSYVRFCAWFNAIVAPVYFLFLRNSDLDVVAPATGSTLLLGLFCFETNLRRFWFPIAVCSFTMIAAEVRAEWAGFGIALMVWGVITKKLGRLFLIAGIIFVLLLIGFMADVRLPGLPGRGGEISARDTIGRALSSVNPELAREYSPSAAIYAGTVSWRTNWWKAIREEVSRNYTTLAFGLGYGYPINRLVSYLKHDEDVHTPHSIFYFNLAYGGWIGVLLFFSLQISILYLLWKTYKKTGQVYGLVFHTFNLVGAQFGNLFERPQGAIPLYLIVGMCIGPLFLERYLLEEGLAQRTTSATMNMTRALAPKRRTAQQALVPSRFVHSRNTNS
jgi:hypothetical protein